MTINNLCAQVDELRLIAGDGQEIVRCVCAVEGVRSAALAEQDCLALLLCSDGQLMELLRHLSAAAVLLEENRINEDVLALCREQEIAVLSGSGETVEQQCRHRLEEGAEREKNAILTVKSAMAYPEHAEVYRWLMREYQLESLCLVAVELRNEEGEPLSELRRTEILRGLKYRTRRSEIPVIWFEKDALLYGLFGGTDEQAREIAEQAIQVPGEGEQLRIAVSRTAQDISELAVLDRHVHMMLRLLWAGQVLGAICSYRELGMYQMLLSIEDPNTMRQFYQETLSPLEEYDRKNGTDYVGLLQCYLKHNAGVSATAAALFLHRNSVNYKLNRIQEILGCSLSRQEVRSRLLVAFMIRDLI
ncbi:MAG: PucR family transcriptional regulator [Butyricicoccaceae bacterium]